MASKEEAADCFGARLMLDPPLVGECVRRSGGAAREEREGVRARGRAVRRLERAHELRERRRVSGAVVMAKANDSPPQRAGVRAESERDGILNARFENRLMVPTDFSNLK